MILGKGETMTDILFLLAGVLFFVVSSSFVALCTHLMEETP
jgi:hypothetical protein